VETVRQIQQMDNRITKDTNLVKSVSPDLCRNGRRVQIC